MKFIEKLFFSQKLLILLGVSLLILFFGLTVIVFYFYRDTQLKIKEEGYKIVSEQTENFLKNQVKERSRTLELQLKHSQDLTIYAGNIFSKRKNIQSKESIEEILKNVFNSLESSGSKIYYYSNKSGLLTYPAINYLKQNEINFNIQLPHYLPGKKQISQSDKNVFWSKPHDSLLEENQDWVVDVFVPIDSENPFEAFVGVSISITQLIIQFNQTQHSRGSYSFLLDESLNLIAALPHARLELAPSEKFIPRGLIQLKNTGSENLDNGLKEMSLGGSSILKVQIKGEEKYLAFHPLKELNWRLGIVVPVSTATSASFLLQKIIINSMTQSLTSMAIGGILTLAFAILIGGILIKKLLQPLQLVSTVSKSIAEGNFEKRVNITSYDEIGSLANVFNRMADQIQHLILNLEKRAIELENLNLSLEQKVDKRTFELQSSKTDLEEINKKLQLEIKERESAEKKLVIANNTLENLVKIDGLTGIANRRYLNLKLEEEWIRLTREKSPISFILFDVDFFKLYNDNYGHQAGDTCLVQVAQICLEVLKRPADLVARYGGEEFAIILPNTDKNGAIKVVEEIQKIIKKRKLVHGFSPVNKYLTISFGINTEIPDKNSSVDHLISKADKALYLAKNQGRNRFVVAG